ncbi:MAG: TrbI/VirB10 family protein [Acidobacteria bacterium]|nr:TrbI/VirB10 family protein [Acidobacteriota bacterium]
MPLWKLKHANPAGAIPGGFATKAAVGLFAVVFAAYLLSISLIGNGEPPDSGPNETASEPPSIDAFRASQRQIDQEAGRIQQIRAAEARDKLRRDEEQRRENRFQDPPTGTPSSGSGQSMTEEEWRLQERLRLEELERKRRSLRAVPLVHSRRDQQRALAASPPAPTAPPGGGEDSQPDDTPPSPVDDLRTTLELLGQPGAIPSGEQLVPPETTGSAPAGGPAERNYADPVRISAASDPPGWERIHEGAFLEAALVTQLSGDFPGPVLAQVSVPFYSRDRQRVLIPMGSRVVGTAQAADDRDQGRLAIGFHRLILPDGRWIALHFHGLNQVGESALKDKVNRHYISMFAAVGAVGVLSGLTLQGSNPYAGGGGGFRAGAGQGFGQAATQILQRFLNRLPSITIRAGHRLRVWFTSDVLVPRPDAA